MMLHFLFAVPTSPAQTSKTKHSLLPDSSNFSNVAKRSISGSRKQPVILPALKNDNAPTGSSNKNLTAPYVRWAKSLSCYASIPSTIKEKQPSIDTGTTDGFLVHEFAPSPVNVPGTVLFVIDISLCDVTLRCLLASSFVYTVHDYNQPHVMFILRIFHIAYHMWINDML